jgi:hypothetical protein
LTQAEDPGRPAAEDRRSGGDYGAAARGQALLGVLAPANVLADRLDTLVGEGILAPSVYQQRPERTLSPRRAQT